MANADAFNSGFNMGFGGKRTGKQSKVLGKATSTTADGDAKPKSFKHGGKVKKTGYAKVHKGEIVLTASQNKGRTRKRGKKSARKKITKR